MSKQNLTQFPIILSLLILVIIGIFIFQTTDRQADATLGTSVFNSDGKQIIALVAKAGYSPANIKAKAGEDTVLRVKTNSTFDCSAALTIPKLGIRKNLPPTATTDIPLGIQNPGTKIAGTCAMGMYNFNLSFN